MFSLYIIHFSQIPYCTPWKQVILCNPQLREDQIMLHILRANYQHKIFGIFLHRRFAYLSFTYLTRNAQPYLIFQFIIPYLFIHRTISVTACAIIYPHYCLVFVCLEHFLSFCHYRLQVHLAYFQPQIQTLSLL